MNARRLSTRTPESYPMKSARILAAAVVALAASAHAQPNTNDHAAHHPVAASAPIAAPRADGEVRKVDKEQGKITLRHGPIANLDMPAMTMVFKVAEPGLLDTVKEGDKVRFAADKMDGALTVTAIEVVR